MKSFFLKKKKLLGRQEKVKISWVKHYFNTIQCLCTFNILNFHIDVYALLLNQGRRSTLQPRKGGGML